MNDRKKALAHEIFNETALLHEQQKEQADLIDSLIDGNKNYSDAAKLSLKLRDLSKDIKKQIVKIEGLQLEHDLYIEKP